MKANETGKFRMCEPKQRTTVHKVFGAMVSIMGVFWLAKRTVQMPHESPHSPLLWPLVVIATGLFILFGPTRGRREG